jgi:hypothetical protein
VARLVLWGSTQGWKEILVCAHLEDAGVQRSTMIRRASLWTGARHFHRWRQ